MKMITYTVTLKSPAIFPHYDGDSNTLASLDYIPGSTILGLLASHLDRHPAKSIGIPDLVLGANNPNNQILFDDAVICTKLETARIVPAGFFVEKGKRGLPHLDDENEQNCVLYPRFEKAPSNSESDIATRRLGNRWCIPSFATVAALSPRMEQFTHNTIDDEKQRPDGAGGVFVYQALSAGQSFQGKIRFSNDKTAAEFLTIFGSERLVYLGKSAGAEYGKAIIRFDNPTDSNVKAPGIQNGQITFFFESDTILLDEMGFPTHQLNGAVIDAYLAQQGFAKLGLTLSTTLLSNFGYRTANGFNGKWGQFRYSLPAIRRGSIAHFDLPAGFDESEVTTSLEALQQWGIGERRHEGFGRVRFENPLFDHFLKAKKAEKNQVDLTSPPKPKPQATHEWWSVATHFPESVREAVFAKKVRIAALEKVKELVLTDSGALRGAFQKFPSNTQLKGLENALLNAREISAVHNFMQGKFKKANKSP